MKHSYNWTQTIIHPLDLEDSNNLADIFKSYNGQRENDQFVPVLLNCMKWIEINLVTLPEKKEGYNKV